MARELKYHTPDTDFAALQRELGGPSGRDERDTGEEHSDSYDPYEEDSDHRAVRRR